MKTKQQKPTQKLRLSRETLRTLAEDQLKQIAGGYPTGSYCTRCANC